MKWLKVNGSNLSHFGGKAVSSVNGVPVMCGVSPVGSTVSYTITTTVTNGTSSGDTTIDENGTATVTLSASSGYELPQSISVSGASYVYTQGTGTVSLSNPTGNVTISAVCEQSVQAYDYSITVNITSGEENITSITAPAGINEGGTATVVIVADYLFDVAGPISLTAADYSTEKTGSYYDNQNPATMTLTLSNPTSDVTFSVSSERKAWPLTIIQPSHCTVSDNGRPFVGISGVSGGGKITFIPDSGYINPTSASATNCSLRTLYEGRMSLGAATGPVTLTVQDQPPLRNLKNTTWLIDKGGGPEWPSGQNFSYNTGEYYIDSSPAMNAKFMSNGTQFYGFALGGSADTKLTTYYNYYCTNDADYTQTEPTTETVHSGSTWTNNAYKTITFNDNVSISHLQWWLEMYATEQ